MRYASKTDMRAMFAGWVPCGSEKMTLRMARRPRPDSPVKQMRRKLTILGTTSAAFQAMQLSAQPAEA
jgi:hypothetical protein